MRPFHFAAAGLAAALFAFSAAASAGGKDAAEPFHLKLEDSGPGTGIVQLESRPDSGEAERAALFKRLLEPAADGNVSDAAPIPAGMPPVPASLPPVKPSASGQEPGVPVQVFTSLGAAAAAGVDPLQERDAAPAAAPAKQAAAPEAKDGFNWADPGAYVALASKYRSELIQGVLGVVVGVLLLWLVRRRRR